MALAQARGGSPPAPGRPTSPRCRRPYPALRPGSQSPLCLGQGNEKPSAWHGRPPPRPGNANIPAGTRALTAPDGGNAHPGPRRGLVTNIELGLAPRCRAPTRRVPTALRRTRATLRTIRLCTGSAGPPAASRGMLGAARMPEAAAIAAAIARPLATSAACPPAPVPPPGTGCGQPRRPAPVRRAGGSDYRPAAAGDPGSGGAFASGIPHQAQPEPHHLDPSSGARCPAAAAAARQWSTVVFAGRECPAATRLPGQPRRGQSRSPALRLPACWHPGRRPSATPAGSGARRRSPGGSGPSGARSSPATFSLAGRMMARLPGCAGSGHLGWPD
jgi:hypothetical protein